MAGGGGLAPPRGAPRTRFLYDAAFFVLGFAAMKFALSVVDQTLTALFSARFYFYGFPMPLAEEGSRAH